MSYRQAALLLAVFLPLAGAGVGRPQPPREPAVDGKSVSEWARQLKSPAAQERQAAAEALAKLGADARDATPALVEALPERDPAVAGRVREALARIGPAAAPALAEALAKPELRGGAALVLGDLGADAKPAVPALLRALKGVQPGPPALAARSPLLLALARVGPDAVPPLVEWLRDADPELRNSAATALALIGPAARPAVPALIGMLKDAEAANRREAAIALGSIGPGASDAAVPLVEFLKSLPAERKAQARLAGLALSRIGKAAVPALMGGVKGDNATARVECASALGLIGPDAAEAVPALVEALKPGSGLEGEAADALGRIGPAAKEAVPALLVLLGQPPHPARRQAVRALGALGPDAKDAVPLLARIMSDPSYPRGGGDGNIEYDCAHALGKIGAPAVPALLPLLRDARAIVGRHAALSALTAMGPAAKDAVPTLIELLQSEPPANPSAPGPGPIVIGPNGGVSRQLSPPAEVLRAVGKPAVPALVEALKGPDARQREQIILILAAVGPDAREAVPVLAELWKDEKNAAVRAAAEQALRAIDPEELKKLKEKP